MRSLLVIWLLRHGLPPWLAPDYVALVGIAGLLGAAAALRLSEKDRAPVHLEARALCVGYVAALLGGYVFEAIRAIPAALAAGSWGPILGAGRAAYGGLLAGIGASLLYLRLRRVPLAPFLDRLTPLLGITFACVRLGCFLAGCDYGRPTASVLGVRFPAGSLAAADHAALGWVRTDAPSLPVHPTELYEAALGLAATLVAWAWLRRGIRDGRPFAAWIAVYAVGRFAIEALRGDASRGVYGGLSTAQLVSLALLMAVAFWASPRRARLAVAASVVGAALLVPSVALTQPAPDKGKSKKDTPAPSASASAPPAPAPSGAQPYPYPYPYPQGQPYPYPYPYPQGQPYPYPYPYPQGQPYPYPYPPPAATAPPVQEPPKKPKPEEPPLEPRHVTLRVAGGMGMTLGNSAVPLGGFVDVLAAWRFNLSPKVRLELGLEGRFFRNVEATHISLGLPIGFGFVLARNVELTTHIALGPTWFLFDSPFFTNTNAWGARYELGLQFPVANRVIFGTAPLAFSLVGSQSVGLLTMWEPRLWMGVAL